MSRNNPYIPIRHMLDSAQDAFSLYEDLPLLYTLSHRYDLADAAARWTVPDDALIRRMEVIGEAARRIPSEFRERHPHIPWTLIVDFRNLLIHEYNRINIDKMHKIIRDDIPILIPQLEAILADESD